MSLKIEISTPPSTFWNGQAEEIVLNTPTGPINVLKNHAPMIATLDVDILLIRTKDEWIVFYIMGGSAFVKDNYVSITTYFAESAKTIDLEEAKISFEKAKANLEKAEGVTARAYFDYKRTKARLRVAKGLYVK